MSGELSVEHSHHFEATSNDVFGFWLYIMTDCILFGCLFATYLVLNMPGIEGPGLKNYLDLNDILIETFLLLASNFVFGLAILRSYKNKIAQIQGWLALSFLLGAGFVWMELREFAHLAQEGFRWDLCGKASSFFTLVGTHGLHVSCGLFWIATLIIQMFFVKNMDTIHRRLTYLGLFWNFLDIVWIFVFTVVYLTGALQ